MKTTFYTSLVIYLIGVIYLFIPMLKKVQNDKDFRKFSRGSMIMIAFFCCFIWPFGYLKAIYKYLVTTP